MISTRKKQNVIKKYQVKASDTGSPEVQIALLSTQIDELASHLKKHKKDNHSRRGLLQMVADRRSLLNHLAKTNDKRYQLLAKKLGLKTKSK